MTVDARFRIYADIKQAVDALGKLEGFQREAVESGIALGRRRRELAKLEVDSIVAYEKKLADDRKEIVRRQVEAVAALEKRRSQLVKLEVEAIASHERRLAAERQGIAGQQANAERALIERRKVLLKAQADAESARYKIERDQVRAIEEDKKRLERQQERLAKGTERHTGLVSKLAAAYATLRVGQFIKESIQLAVTMERSANALQIATKTAEATREEFERIAEVSETLGFNFVQTTQAYSKFAAAAAQAGIPMENIRATFDGVLIAARGANIQQEEMRLILLALSQVASKGTLYMEELRQQLAEKLPGSMKILSDSFGMTIQEFSLAVERGQISAEEFFSRIGPALSEAFGDAAQRNAASMAAQMERFNNIVNRVKLSLAGGFASQLSSGITEVTKRSKDLEESARALGQGIGGIVQGLVWLASQIPKVRAAAAAAVVTLMQPLVMFLDALSKIPLMGQKAKEQLADAARAVKDLQYGFADTAVEQWGLGVAKATDKTSGLKSEVQSLVDHLKALRPTEFDGVAAGAERLAHRASDLAKRVEVVVDAYRHMTKNGELNSAQTVYLAQQVQILINAYSKVKGVEVPAELKRIADEMGVVASGTKDANKEVNDLIESFGNLEKRTGVVVEAVNKLLNQNDGVLSPAQLGAARKEVQGLVDDLKSIGVTELSPELVALIEKLGLTTQSKKELKEETKATTEAYKEFRKEVEEAAAALKKEADAAADVAEQNRKRIAELEGKNATGLNPEEFNELFELRGKQRELDRKAQEALEDAEAAQAELADAIDSGTSAIQGNTKAMEGAIDVGNDYADLEAEIAKQSAIIANTAGEQAKALGATVAELERGVDAGGAFQGTMEEALAALQNWDSDVVAESIDGVGIRITNVGGQASRTADKVDDAADAMVDSIQPIAASASEAASEVAKIGEAADVVKASVNEQKTALEEIIELQATIKENWEKIAEASAKAGAEL